MSRPRASRTMSADDIRAEIVSETGQLSLLRTDLREALLACESTASYRAAIAATEKSIEALKVKLEALQQDEAESRRVLLEGAGREISAESSRRYAAMAAEFLPPAPPSILKDFCP